ncbi:MAG: thiol peroxidase [Pirellulaceae bacterium]|nr:thiol peroxidase [Planctomycetales bacterium]
MKREAAVTFKGAPMTLVGNPLEIGSKIPEFTLHYYEGGLKTLSPADLLGKPTLISVVPSLDTGVCAIQTKHFNTDVAALGDQINAVTVSLDLPFAQGRFCSENGVSMRTASDYQNRSFGEACGMLIDELKLLTRAVVVLDANGQVVYTEVVPEVTSEPNYAAALEAINSCLNG